MRDVLQEFHVLQLEQDCELLRRQQRFSAFPKGPSQMQKPVCLLFEMHGGSTKTYTFPCSCWCISCPVQKRCALVKRVFASRPSSHHSTSHLDGVQGLQNGGYIFVALRYVGKSTEYRTWELGSCKRAVLQESSGWKPRALTHTGLKVGYGEFVPPRNKSSTTPPPKKKCPKTPKPTRPNHAGHILTKLPATITYC